MADPEPILEVRNVKKYFSQSTNLLDLVRRRGAGQIQAVDGVSLSLFDNDSQGIIGESGCGKSTLLLTLLGLERPTAGEIFFDGRDVSEFTRRDWKEFRRSVQIVFQDPFNSLDPKMTVREAVDEPLDIHDMDDRDERIHRTMEEVELQPPEKYLDRYPGQLSGGEKQRVAIARALVVDPDVILADEPVSMLDVSTQAAILNLLSDLIDNAGVSMLYVSHDLSTVSYVCQKINVMYLGRIVETAPTEQLLGDPKHPYAQALINAVPIPDPTHRRERTRLEGEVQNPVDIGEGCRFRNRCPDRMDVCERTPAFLTIEDDRQVACHLYYDHDAYEAEADESLVGAHQD